MSLSTSRARLTVERLEDRLVPDASVAVVDGTLVIRGTNAAEHLIVDFPFPIPATIVEAKGGTTFNNGQTREIFLPASRVTAELRGGADRLFLGSSFGVEATLSAFQIDGGTGKSTIQISGISLRQSLSIVTADGNDAIVLKNQTLSGPVRVQTGAGADRLSLTDTILSNESVWSLGGGNDLVATSGVRFDAVNDWRLGGGNDLVNLGGSSVLLDAVWSLGTGDDFFLTSDNLLLGSVLKAGDGRDLLVVRGALIEGDTRWSMGAGDDRVLVDGAVFSGVLSLDGGGGDNTFLDVNIPGSLLDGLSNF